LFRFLLLSVFAVAAHDSVTAWAGGGKAADDIQNFVEGDLKSLRDLSRHDFVVSKMVYATDQNFLGKNIYQSFKVPLAHKITDQKLVAAAKELKRLKPLWKFIIYDALRPHRYQIILWEKVVGTAQESYVMNPKFGSIHSYGFALDITLQDEKGQEVDMGTPVDTLGRLSEPRHEESFLKNGQLTQGQVANRKVLRQAMESGGFRGISNEWWHFEALGAQEVRTGYSIYK